MATLARFASASALLLLLAACTSTDGGQQGASSSAGSASSQAISDLIQVTSPKPNASITSPLSVSGKALGTWFFEASFPVTLKDAHGNVLVQMPAQAQGNWMTTGFVPFQALLNFVRPKTATGTLVLQNDNPSGDPSQAKQVVIPVKF